MPSNTEPFIVSAPGKVIIFGEHSAVYGKPAIAAALSLRCYLLVAPSKDTNTIRLQFPDIELDHSWDKRSIPWSNIRKSLKYDENGYPIPPSELVPEIVENLSGMLGGFEDNNVHHLACFCFIYLYVCLCKESCSGMTFIVRSTLPIGAGLGSSASTAVCLSAALSRLGGWINDPHVRERDATPKQDIPDLEFIDRWSLIGEKCFHGNPSGIDNAVATHGGAVMFQRSSVPEKPSVRTNIRTLPPIKLLLTNTKVPKSTAQLVGGVGKLNNKYPSILTPVLDSMGSLVQEAYRVMIHPNFGTKETAILRELVNINHGLLVALGVSHPSLEKVKMIGEEMKIGATKLTGAGGGGCAITLVNDGVEEPVIHQAMLEYERQGFESFETSLGGKGVGMLFQSDSADDKKFSQDSFCSYANRLEIETALAVENVAEWKFW
ncbi:Erg12 protein [Candida orthopsilosis Co 90-125]|uniref:Mevalonate kinase n=1 Tax=Candida orthopsilosis (strain 90-125) TaxID=1136231 RepID=H8WWB9_CANO9|nr:Erg12 protein [Candida orthopsilosis Co 90-125]CCG20743.1 Erg12 protein [Candida orthopsilosis Co 90-125]